jgi:hypothetical protein
MWDAIVDLFEPIINIFTGDGGNGIVGAVAESALKTAVTGALTGAVVAAIKGDDIVKGGLQGAAYGAVLGGVLGGISGYTSTGIETPRLNVAGASGSHPRDERSGLLVSKTQSSTPVANVQPTGIAAPAPEKESFFKSDEGKKALFSAGVGALDAYLGKDNLSKEYDARANADIKVLREKQKIDQEKIAANRPGKLPEYSKQIANIDPGRWWRDKIGTTVGVNRGIQEVA